MCFKSFQIALKSVFRAFRERERERRTRRERREIKEREERKERGERTRMSQCLPKSALKIRKAKYQK